MAANACRVRFVIFAKFWLRVSNWRASCVVRAFGFVLTARGGSQPVKISVRARRKHTVTPYELRRKISSFSKHYVVFEFFEDTYIANVLKLRRFCQNNGV